MTPEPDQHINEATATEVPDDPRLLQIVQEHMNALERGERPDREALRRLYPDLAKPLDECLDGLELLHQAATGHRADSLGAAAAEPPIEPLTANPLGDFRIIREIGRGGMGVVYEAVQLSLGRKVALKVLPFAATFDARHLQRFQNEAQAAAQLHHTNIVPVYAVGCERGMHFYAMQLIDGQSLAAIIRQLRRHSGRPVEEEPHPDSSTSSVWLSPTQKSISQLVSEHSFQRHEFFRSAARLALQAAQALEHAHEFGIIHRDIKPANLLVDGHGRMWITDFGLAQFNVDNRLTRTGDIVGTLRYMSPEQAAGQRTLLDHRADIYSLGATLYELVTLEPIFSGVTHAELLQQIARQEPRAPRSIERSVPIELETIILKAVSKHPSERYASAREMAEDLQHFLDYKPIRAKRPSLFDRLRKWSRRHPSLVAAAVLLLLLCIAGLLVNNWMIAREQSKTQAALQNEKQRAADARSALGLLVDISEQELSDAPHLQGLRRKLLETVLTYYQNFIDTHGNDAASQVELKAGKERVRQILDELSSLEGANLVRLLVDPAVQADLQLNEEQKRKAIEVNDRSSEERLALFRGATSATSGQRRQKFYLLAKSQEAALGTILRSDQLWRLRQIELQVQGPRAFHESHAVEALKLTAVQKQKIRDIKADVFATIALKASEPGRPDESAKKAHFDDLMKRETQRIEALLTPDQKHKWEELTGRPIEGVKRLPPPDGFGPPPRFVP